MRLNTNTYPAYFNIQSMQRIHYLEVDDNFRKYYKKPEDIVDMLEAIVQVYRQVKHRYYITAPFKNAVSKAYTKIIKDLKHMDYDKPDAGIMFVDNGFTLYLMNPPDKMVKAVLYGFSKNVLTSFAYMLPDGRIFGSWFTKEGDDKEGLAGWAHTVLATYYFINECDTDQLVVAPGKKSDTKKSDPRHIYNEAKEPVTVLDCQWFTEIIRNTPFMVNGHFRWQPFGPNHAKRRLQWIDEFQKEGYHRKASKDL